MFFILRAGFWLILLFVCLRWNNPSENQKHMDDMKSGAVKSLDDAKSRFAATCLDRPKLCLDAAARLKEIIAEEPKPSKAKPENKGVPAKHTAADWASRK